MDIFGIRDITLQHSCTKKKDNSFVKLKKAENHHIEWVYLVSRKGKISTFNWIWVIVNDLQLLQFANCPLQVFQIRYTRHTSHRYLHWKYNKEEVLRRFKSWMDVQRITYMEWRLNSVNNSSIVVVLVDWKFQISRYEDKKSCISPFGK